MKVKSLRKKVVVTYLMDVDNEEYTRHGPLDWTYEISYDIHSSTESCGENLSQALEELFNDLLPYSE